MIVSQSIKTRDSFSLCRKEPYRNLKGPGQKKSQRNKEGTLGWGWGWAAWGQACYRCFITYAWTTLSSFLHPRQKHPLPSQPLTDIKRLFRGRIQRQPGTHRLDALLSMGELYWNYANKCSYSSSSLLHPHPHPGSAVQSSCAKRSRDKANHPGLPSDHLKGREEVTKEQPGQLSPGAWSVF